MRLGDDRENTIVSNHRAGIIALVFVYKRKNKMLKSILLLVGLSVGAIFFQNQLLAALHFLLQVHNSIAKGLGSVFSLDSAGEVVQSVLALLVLPVAIGIIMAIAHFFIKQEHFPHTMSVVWIAWAICLISVLSQAGHVTNQSAQEIQSAKQVVADGKQAELAQAEAAQAAAEKKKHSW